MSFSTSPRPFGMAAARQGLPVRLDRAPQRGAAFAITRASRRARTRSIGSRPRARGSSLIFDHPPAVALVPLQIAQLGSSKLSCFRWLLDVIPRSLLFLPPPLSARSQLRLLRDSPLHHPQSRLVTRDSAP